MCIIQDVNVPTAWSNNYWITPYGISFPASNFGRICFSNPIVVRNGSLQSILVLKKMYFTQNYTSGLKTFFQASESTHKIIMCKQFFPFQYFLAILMTTLYLDPPSENNCIWHYYQKVSSRRFHQTLPNLGLILGLKDGFSFVSKYVGRIEPILS